MVEIFLMIREFLNFKIDFMGFEVNLRLFFDLCKSFFELFTLIFFSMMQLLRDNIQL
jgi:hypothetical protein